MKYAITILLLLLISFFIGRTENLYEGYRDSIFDSSLPWDVKMEYFNALELEAFSKNDVNLLARALLSKSSIYLIQNNFDSAGHYLNEVYKIFPNIDSKGLKYRVNFNTATANLKMENPKRALVYLNKCERMEPPSQNLVFLYNNFAAAYSILEEWEMLGKYMRKAIYYAEIDSNYDALLRTESNYIDLLLEVKKLKEAKKHMQRVHTFAKRANSPFFLIEVHLVSSKYYKNIGEYSQALTHLRKADSLCLKYDGGKLGERIFLNFSNVYNELKEFDKALIYYKNYTDLKDSFARVEEVEKLNNSNFFYQEQLNKREIREKEMQIALQQANRRDSLIIYSCIIVVVIMIAVFVTMKIKTNADKRKQTLMHEKKMVEAQIIMANREIEIKKRDLTNFAMDICRKNDFNISVSNKILDIYSIKDQAEMKKALKQFSWNIKNELQINDNLQELQDQSNKISLEFYNRLKLEYPNLTKNDLRLCGLIRLNLSRKEIATILNTSSNTIKSRLFRMKRKMKLGDSENLKARLEEFN